MPSVPRRWTTRIRRRAQDRTQRADRTDSDGLPGAAWKDERTSHAARSVGEGENLDHHCPRRDHEAGQDAVPVFHQACRIRPSLSPRGPGNWVWARAMRHAGSSHPHGGFSCRSRRAEHVGWPPTRPRDARRGDPRPLGLTPLPRDDASTAPRQPLRARGKDRKIPTQDSVPSRTQETSKPHRGACLEEFDHGSAIARSLPIPHRRAA